MSHGRVFRSRSSCRRHPTGKATCSACRRASRSGPMRELPRTITETAQRLRSRDVSALELAEAFLERAQADPYNAWLTVEPEHARAQARVADAKLRAADPPLL